MTIGAVVSGKNDASPETFEDCGFCLRAKKRKIDWMNSFDKTSVNLKTQGRPAVYQLAYWKAQLAHQEDRVFLILTFVIGALAGLAVVAFILLTERLGARIYPPGVSVWRRLIGPMAGALSMGYVLTRFFPTREPTASCRRNPRCIRRTLASRCTASSGNSFARR